MTFSPLYILRIVRSGGIDSYLFKNLVKAETMLSLLKDRNVNAYLEVK